MDTLILSFVWAVWTGRLQDSGVLYHVRVVTAELICRIFTQTTTMAHTNPADDEELDDDPGAYVIGFGKHAGERLDSIPTHYRLWATGTECQHFRWVRTQCGRYDCH